MPDDQGRKWVILAALPIELEATADRFGLRPAGTWAQTPIHRGTVDEIDLTAIVTGVGKVRAAATTQYAIDRFGPTDVLLLGATGALDLALAPGHVIVARRVIEYDFDDRALARRPGKLLRSWSPDHDLALDLGRAAGRAVGPDGFSEGTVLTGDRCVTDSGERDRLRRRFRGDCVDMEAAAVAAISALNGIAFGMVRVVSDRADRTAPTVFTQTLTRVGPVLARIIGDLIELTSTVAAPRPVHRSAPGRVAGTTPPTRTPR